MAISDVNNDTINDIVTANTLGTVLTVFYFTKVTQDFGASSQIDLPADNYVRSVFVCRSS
jgi:hypothetical protein